jgi:oligopeptide/dipeptide ABC transporter ATP-binding protein
MTALLDIADLTVTFQTDGLPVQAVRGVSLSVAEGEVVGIVGESGSGKSVTMLAAVRLLDESRAALGATRLRIGGEDVLAMTSRALARLRGPVVSFIFQDPLTALNPLLTVGRQITEGLRRHLGRSAAEARATARDLLVRVGIPEPDLRLRQYPHQLSGGMRQRVMIAVALAMEPKLLVADEPTTALDVTVQAEIVRLIKSVQAERRMGLVWITHDLALLARLADRVVVMYAGAVVEEAPIARLYAAAAHPYTAGLLASTAHIDDPFVSVDPIPGQPPDPSHLPPGCAFSPRCARATDRCRTDRPLLADVAPGQRVACWHPLSGEAP